MSRRYKNPYVHNAHRTLWDLLLWKTGRYDGGATNLDVPFHFSYPNQIRPLQPNLPRCTWIGHSTFFIQLGNTSLLTDPIWSTHCSPIAIKGLERRHEPPLSLLDLPKIDFVLMSHNHYDHLDLKTVKQIQLLNPNVKWILPLGLTRWFHKHQLMQTHELDRWEQITLNGCQITAVPAQHFSGRGLFDKNKTFWNGYVVEDTNLNKRLYFTGDTGYNPFEFKEIGSRWPYMDLSLIPIGTYIPQQFMQPVHCSPQEAVAIHVDVHSKLSVGMHWKTFCLSDEPLDRPPYDLFLAMQERKIPYETFLALDPGVTINW